MSFAELRGVVQECVGSKRGRDGAMHARCGLPMEGQPVRRYVWRRQVKGGRVRAHLYSMTRTGGLVTPFFVVFREIPERRVDPRAVEDAFWPGGKCIADDMSAIA